MEEDNIKCVVVGDRGTGKSALIEAFVNEKNDENFHLTFDIPTVIEKSTKAVRKSRHVLDIWEVGGDSTDVEFRKRVAYPRAEVVVVTFNKSNPGSFASIKEKWAPEIHEHLPGVPIIVVATKMDEVGDEAKHIDDKSIILDAKSKKEARGSSIKGKDYIQCSAKENTKIEYIFSKAEELGLKRRKKVRKSNKKAKRPAILNSTADLLFQAHEPFLGLENDENCLEYLKQDYQKVEEGMNKFYKESGQNILHIIVQRHFLKTLAFILDQYPNDSGRMLKEININHRTPLMLASKNKEIYDMIESFMKNKEISFSRGMDRNGLEPNLILWYVHYGLNKLAKSVLSKSTKDELKMLLIETDEERNTVLLKTQSESLGIYIINNYADQIDMTAKNIEDENIAHKFAKQGFNVSAILAKLEANTKDILEILSQPDIFGNTPLMVSAKHPNGGNALLCFLTFYHNQKNEEYKDNINTMLHIKNKKGQTLFFLLFLRKLEFQNQYGMVKELEKYVHDDKDPTKAKQDYLRCLREHEISKMEIKDIDKANTEVSKVMTWVTLSFAAFFIPLASYSADITTDSMLTRDYFLQYQEQMKQNMSDFIQNENITILDENATFNENYTFCNLNTKVLIGFPNCLQPLWKFSYSCVFMILPWLFYMYECATSGIFQRLKGSWRRQGSLAWKNMSNCEISNSVMPYLKSISAAFLIPVIFITWPICTKAIHFYYVAKYTTSLGDNRAGLESKMWDSALYAARAHILEVCTEASFEPLLQWYQLFPRFLHWCHQVDVEHFDYKHYIQDVGSLKLVVSLASSIFSLGWSFSVYKVAQKRGTLDLGENLAGRLVLFLSNLFLVVARLQAIIMFTYYFGPGKFFPSFLFIAGHVILISVLHGIFSEVKGIWEHQKPRSAMICLINGLANIFVHNNIGIDDIKRIDQGARWKPTFLRQLTFDIIFLLENGVLTAVGALNDTKPLNVGFIRFYIIGAIFSCHFLGLIFKYIYYTKLHTWSFLSEKVKFDNHHIRLEFKYFILDDTQTSTFTFPYVCLLPNMIKRVFSIFITQIKRMFPGFQSNKETNKYGWCEEITIAFLCSPLYILLIILAVIALFLIFILITLFIIIGFPLFLIGQCICHKNEKKVSIKDIPPQVSNSNDILEEEDQEMKRQNDNSSTDDTLDEENEAHIALPNELAEESIV